MEMQQGKQKLVTGNQFPAASAARRGFTTSGGKLGKTISNNIAFPKNVANPAHLEIAFELLDLMDIGSEPVKNINRGRDQTKGLQRIT